MQSLDDFTEKLKDFLMHQSSCVVDSDCWSTLLKGHFTQVMKVIFLKASQKS